MDVRQERDSMSMKRKMAHEFCKAPGRRARIISPFLVKEMIYQFCQGYKEFAMSTMRQIFTMICEFYNIVIYRPCLAAEHCNANVL